MADNGNGMTITTYQHGLAEIVVYRPQLTAEEEEKRNRRIVAALAQYGRELYRSEMKERGNNREGAEPIQRYRCF